MRKVLMIAAALLVLPALASAQAPTPFSIHVGGLVSLPNSPDQFADAYKTGFHGSVGLGYKLFPGLQAVGKVEYHRFELDHGADPWLATLEIDGGHNNMWMFGVDGRWAFNVPQAPFKPYALGGVGMARISVTEFEGAGLLAAGLNEFQPEAQSELYFNVGGGLEFLTGPMWSLFGQVRYVSVQTEGEASTFIPITIGLKFF